MAKVAHPPSTSSSLLLHLRDPADTQAWRAFVDLYSPLVFGFACRRGLQEADAQDVVQQVFMQVAPAIRGFEYDRRRGQFRAWLGTITAHTIARQWERQGRAGHAPGMGADEQTLEHLPSNTDPSWIDDFNQRVCQVALARIREEFDDLVWRAFEMTWLENRDAQEAAAAIQKPAAWIYKAKFKVIQRLKQEIEFLTDDMAYFNRE